MLNYIFNAQYLPTITSKCGCGQKYTNNVAFKVKLVVDWMLLVIAVLFRTDIKRKEEKYWKVFEKVQIQHYTIKGIYIIPYKPIKCVFYISKTHYTAY